MGPLRNAPPPRKHDATYKHLFAQPVAARSLIRDFIAPDWADALELSTLARIHTENVGPGLSARISDFAWRVGLRDDTRSVIFLVEFQSSDRRGLVLRTWRYAQEAWGSLFSNKDLLDPGGVMPLVLSCVLATGPGPWRSATSLAALGPTAPWPAAVEQGTAGLRTAFAHLLLDLRRAYREDLLPQDTVVHWIGALECDPWETWPRVCGSLAKRFGDPEHAEFRGAFARWTNERFRAAGGSEQQRRTIARQIIDAEEEDMAQTYEEWAEGHRRRGQAQGRADMVVRLASRKFGAQTAARLEALVRLMGEGELAPVADAVLDCETGDELLERAANGSSTGK